MCFDIGESVLCILAVLWFKVMLCYFRQQFQYCQKDVYKQKHQVYVEKQDKKFKLTSEDLEDWELQMTARCRTWSLWLFCPGFTNVASFSKSC